jgi:hypothetical protein
MIACGYDSFITAFSPAQAHVGEGGQVAGDDFGCIGDASEAGEGVDVDDVGTGGAYDDVHPEDIEPEHATGLMTHLGQRFGRFERRGRLGVMLA